MMENRSSPKREQKKKQESAIGMKIIFANVVNLKSSKMWYFDF